MKRPAIPMFFLLWFAFFDGAAFAAPQVLGYWLLAAACGLASLGLLYLLRSH